MKERIIVRCGENSKKEGGYYWKEKQESKMRNWIIAKKGLSKKRDREREREMERNEM